MDTAQEMRKSSWVSVGTEDSAGGLGISLVIWRTSFNVTRFMISKMRQTI